MAATLATPGVYIEEKSSFGSSVVPVQTAIPAFIGYTQKASRGSKDLTNEPTKISSLGQYEELFGGAPETKFTIETSEDFITGFQLSFVDNTRFLMHNSMRFFYANGGGDCYIVSVGNYDETIDAGKLNDPKGGGLAALEKHLEPTLVVVPDAVLLSEADCYSLQAAVLSHCGFKMKNRFAILDVYNGTQERTFDDEDAIGKFREGVGSNFLMWGASYYPFLNTTLVKSSEIDYTKIENLDGLIEVLTKEVADNLASESITEARAEGINAEINKISEDNDADAVKSLHSTLTVISPKLNMIIAEMSEMLNLMPPSSAMAGAYAMVDFTASVAQSPANISLGSVISPAVNINNDNQEDLNLPLNGKAVNAIRSFQGKGVLVWGARTLDGNSKDYRYISVRRTMTYLEQSIKFAAEAFVFSPNNSTTWSTLRATVINFLTNQWQSGLLAGQSPEDAFDVEIGLGSTMTPNDILDGVLKMTIKVAITRPAEFIVITFEQQQQKS
ncbi:MAG: phage tail sheath C-terminal domain-containing protein [Flavobacteriaceae bacterium]|jgi:phage tail sheath protein FI|nr:phage tail sheath C-terminal domain-containing protein [Flavobacteriaceae bacterium]